MDVQRPTTFNMLQFSSHLSSDLLELSPQWADHSLRIDSNWVIKWQGPVPRNSFTLLYFGNLYDKQANPALLYFEQHKIDFLALTEISC